MQKSTTSANADQDCNLSEFGHAVAVALTTGRPEHLNRVYQSHLDKQCKDAVSLQMDIIRTCLNAGKKRTARKWVEKLATEPAIESQPEAILEAIELSAAIGHVELVFLFCQKMVATEPSLAAPHCLTAAEHIKLLARRIRLPRGRNGAWATHLKLLKFASQLLEQVLPWLDEVSVAQAHLMLDEIRRLRSVPASQ